MFANDPDQRAREEDSLIAYSWRQYAFNVSRPDINVFFPMVRAAIRSMDAMTAFMRLEFDSNVDSFIFTGFSKRGWATWLTGALDQERVKAIIPGVWDAINFPEIFQNQWRSFKGWSFAIKDYVENQIVAYIGTPKVTLLQNMIDPYHYRTRLTMPKLVITGLMDEFQMTDDEQYWWDDMPSGPTGHGFSNGNTKWLLKSPNSDHTQISNVFVAVPVGGLWVSYLLNEWDIPYLTWDYDADTGDITAYPHGGNVYSAQMWHATSCNGRRRDFRLLSLDEPCECGLEIAAFCLTTESWWYKKALKPNKDGSYTGHLDAPGDGRWSSFVVNIQMVTNHSYYLEDPEHTFFTRGGAQNYYPEPRWPKTPPGVFEFTSRASVVPNIFPYAPCSKHGCMGPLV